MNGKLFYLIATLLLIAGCASPDPTGWSSGAMPTSLSSKVELRDVVEECRVTSNNSSAVEFQPIKGDGLMIMTMPDGSTSSQKISLSQRDIDNEKKKGNRTIYRLSRPSENRTELITDTAFGNFQASITNVIEFTSGTFEDLRRGFPAEFNILETQETLDLSGRFLEKSFNASGMRGRIHDISISGHFGKVKEKKIVIVTPRTNFRLTTTLN